MATITISLAGSATVANASKAFTVSDADLQLLLTWAAAFLPGVPPTPTNPQILLAWVNWLMSNTVRAIQTQLQNPNATAAAVAAVTPASIS